MVVVNVFVSVKVILILSGNLSFLNWLTILPSIFCFDDRSLSWIFPQSSRKAVAVLQQEDLAGIKKSRGLILLTITKLVQ